MPLTDAEDPLTETPPPPVDDDGLCARCHGTRFAQVGPEYAVHMFPDDTPEGPSEGVVRNRAMYGQAVYPCPICAEAQFMRWANGCMRREHHASSCDRCLAVLGKKAASAIDRHAFPNEQIR